MGVASGYVHVAATQMLISIPYNNFIWFYPIVGLWQAKEVHCFSRYMYSTIEHSPHTSLWLCIPLLDPISPLSLTGPLPNTLVDFWRMMWQERPPIIVMLTNLMENNKIKCQQYWPDSGSVSYGPFTVTITDQQVLADYTVRQLQLAVSALIALWYCTCWHY